MKSNQELKEIVKEKYTDIASRDASSNRSSCCGGTGCCDDGSTLMAEAYDQLAGYNPDADLGLGCGLPTRSARIKPGSTVVDLGSGAGNDCFVARAETGPSGKVIGIDMTPVMIDKARENADKLGFNNVEFRLGDIEKIPVGAGKADVVISNCVLNLVPDKRQAFCEINRILKPGGHFSISDIVLEGELPEAVLRQAELYAGCIAGAIQKKEYLDLIASRGFTDIRVEKEKAIDVPDSILEAYLSADELKKFRESGCGIYSITVYAEKQVACGPETGCC